MQGIYSILAFRGPIGCQKYHIFTRVFIEIPYQEEQGILRCEQAFRGCGANRFGSDLDPPLTTPRTRAGGDFQARLTAASVTDSIFRM